MRTEIASYYEIVSRLPNDASVTFHDVSWDEYEELLEQVGEAPGLRISFDNGSLHAMTISSEHERYSEFISSLIAGIRLRLRLGSSTMKKRSLSKGLEPDACFYVQTASTMQKLANKCYALLQQDPQHPSLHFKEDWTFLVGSCRLVLSSACCRTRK